MKGNSRENLNKTADIVNAYESGDDRDGLRTRNVIAMKDKFNQTSTDGDGSKSPMSTVKHLLLQNDQSNDHLLSQMMPEISITKKSHNPSSPF